MLKFDFTDIKEPFDFLYELMKDKSEEEIQEAHRRLCEFLNIRLKIFNEAIKRGKIELDS